MNDRTGLIAGTALLMSMLICDATATPGDTIPHKTGIVVTDGLGKTYDIDSLLNLNKVLVFHQTWDG